MAREPLARIVCDPADLATTIEYAALRSGDPNAHDAMFGRIAQGRIDTPAANPGADLATYCTGRSALYDELTVLGDPPVDVLFDLDAVLSWLAWLDDEEGPMTSTFLGDPTTSVVDRIVHEAGDARVVLPCETDWTLEDISLGLPDRFDGDQFLDAAGDPLPTTIRTDAGTLERLVTANRRARSDDRFAIVAVDGELRLEANRADGLRVAATFDAEVSGPEVRTIVGPDFERAVEALDGPVELQTGPGEPLAVVQDHEAFTLRFVVYPD